MGITNLLKNLSSITVKGVNLSRYAGEVAAVDALCWFGPLLSLNGRLHQSAYGCAKEMCEGGAEDKFDNKGS